ncbi:MAG TPA: CarD family transcriptional regulator [Acetobacteraceae bacterium]|jgi:CarD family transcriptional regulator
MKASGTAATARRDRAHREAASAKPVAKPIARAQAKSTPAAPRKAAAPVAARAAATAVATKSAPAPKKATADASPPQVQSDQAEETATTSVAAVPIAEPAAGKPSASKPASTVAAPKQQADAKPAAGKVPAAAQAPAAQPASEAAAPAESPAAESPAAGSGPAAPAQAEAAAPAQPASRPPADQARRPGAPGMHTGPITAPRIPAKAEVFHEGDHVVYPTHGVGKVERIATEEIAGHKLELIHITFEENRMTLRVPVAKARTAGLRKLATRKLFEEALNVLKGRARIKRTMWSRRAQEYEAKINSGDPLAIAEVVRDLHRNAGQPDQSFSERQIYEAAMERLAAELAALDKTDKATAATKLTDFLKTV